MTKKLKLDRLSDDTRRSWLDICAEVGRQDACTFGDKVETTYIENVPEGPDATQVIRDLAKQGNDIACRRWLHGPDPKIAAEF